MLPLALHVRRHLHWYMEANIAPRETIQLVVTGLRSVLDMNLHPQQLVIWRCQVHCDWPWVCNHTHLFQDSVLAVGWSEHMLGPDYCDVDTVPHPLLGYGAVAVHCTVLAQPTSVCVLGFYH